MKILALALASLRRIARDRVALTFTLFFPASFIVVFGFAFGRGGGGTFTYDLAVVNRDRPVTMQVGASPDTLAFGRDLEAMLSALVYGDSGEVAFDSTRYAAARLRAAGRGGAPLKSARKPVFAVIDTLSSATARPRITGIEAASGQNEPVSAPRSSALLNTPRLMVRKWVAGYTAPIRAPVPSSEDTGFSRPANCTQGIRVPIMVTNMAAIWLRVKVEASRPKPVALITNSKAASVSVATLPFTGTPNTVAASTVMRAKLNIASPT